MDSDPGNTSGIHLCRRKTVCGLSLEITLEGHCYDYVLAAAERTSCQIRAGFH